MEIRYKIESMEESGFKYSPEYSYEDLDLNTVTYQFSHSLTPNADKGEISVMVTAAIMPSNSNLILAEEQIYAIFKIEPFEKAILMTENGFRTTIPQLIDTFISIVIGAIRGMLVKNLKGTPLAKSVMPLIPMDVIHKNTAQLSE